MGEQQTASSALPNVHTISDRQTHDAAVTAAQGTYPHFNDAVPTIIYVSSAPIPACRSAYPRLLEHSATAAWSHVQVHVMELTAETTPMIKFGPQNCPIFILMKGKYCETVLGADWRRLERAVEENLMDGKAS